VSREHKVSKVLKEYKVLKDSREFKEHKVSKVLKESRVLLEHRVQ
jgi:hypothetical protein